MNYAAQIAGQAHVPWLLAGILLHVTSQAVRSRGWFNILRASYPRADALRARDVMAAMFAGSGLNAVLPGRGGDLVKLAFVRRRIDGARYRTLIATAVPETLFESLCAAALMVWVLLQGVTPIPGALCVALTSPPHTMVATLLTLVAAAASIASLRRLRRRSAALATGVGRGLAILSTPAQFSVHVAGWQALARVIRLGSLACFLAAFGLPVTVDAAALVMAVQGGARIIPVAPVSTGLRVAMLGYGLSALTGQAVNPAVITVFTLGTSTVLLVVMLAIATVAIARELGTRSPRLALERARGRLRAPADRPPQPDRLDVELALPACDALGRAVLRPAEA
jgi:Lysylphosphatidylglycerol synthase TM region